MGLGEGLGGENERRKLREGNLGAKINGDKEELMASSRQCLRCRIRRGISVKPNDARAQLDCFTENEKAWWYGICETFL